MEIGILHEGHGSAFDKRKLLHRLLYFCHEQWEVNETFKPKMINFSGGHVSKQVKKNKHDHKYTVNTVVGGGPPQDDIHFSQTRGLSN